MASVRIVPSRNHLSVHNGYTAVLHIYRRLVRLIVRHLHKSEIAVRHIVCCKRELQVTQVRQMSQMLQVLFFHLPYNTHTNNYSIKSIFIIYTIIYEYERFLCLVRRTPRPVHFLDLLSRYRARVCICRRILGLPPFDAGVDHHRLFVNSSFCWGDLAIWFRMFFTATVGWCPLVCILFATCKHL